MSYQQCGTCHEGFSGDDEDEDCDECTVGKIEVCEEKTGHKNTRQEGKDKICNGCHIII